MNEPYTHNSCRRLRAQNPKQLPPISSPEPKTANKRALNPKQLPLTLPSNPKQLPPIPFNVDSGAHLAKKTNESNWEMMVQVRNEVLPT